MARATLCSALLLVVLMAAHFCSAQYEYEGGTACDQRNWKCSENDTREQVPGEGDYAISVEPVICTVTGYPQRYQRLAVKVHWKSCPPSFSAQDLLDWPLPEWYRLTATNLNNTSAFGMFEEENLADVSHCQDSNSMVFRTCEPFILDLPHSFKWLIEMNTIGTVCFRLQVLNSGSNNCSSYTKCVHLDSSSVASTANCTSSSEHDEDDIDRRKREVELEVATAAGQSREEMCQANNNCTGKFMPPEMFCDNAGNRYPTRCHGKLHRCIHKTEFRPLSKCKTGPSPIPTPTPTLPPAPLPPCLKHRQDFKGTSNYQPVSCTCNGLYKPVHCNNRKCWCKYPRGSKKAGTSKTLAYLLDQCTDPATFEFQCYSRSR